MEANRSSERIWSDMPNRRFRSEAVVALQYVSSRSDSTRFTSPCSRHFPLTIAIVGTLLAPLHAEAGWRSRQLVEGAAMSGKMSNWQFSTMK
jgi:hypothetical protein